MYYFIFIIGDYSVCFLYIIKYCYIQTNIIIIIMLMLLFVVVVVLAPLLSLQVLSISLSYLVFFVVDDDVCLV